MAHVDQDTTLHYELHYEPHDLAGGTLERPPSELSLVFSQGEQVIEPTEEELFTLQRVSDRIPMSAWILIFVELAERFTYYGLYGPFQNYMQYTPYSETPGVLGLGQQGASGISNFFNFCKLYGFHLLILGCYFTPIIGAIIADQYLGNILLFATSLPSAIRMGVSLPGFIISIILIGLAAGAIKSNLVPMVAEQSPRSRRTVKSTSCGKRVIVDPAVTAQTVFMTVYWARNVGSLSALVTTLLRMKVDYWASYLLPLVVLIVACIALLLGKNTYIIVPPEGSIVAKSFRAFSIGLLAGGNMDAAKTSFDDCFIEELKRGLVACKIFLFFPVYWICFFQMTNNLISQAAQMNTGNTPNDLLQNFNPIALIVLIPLFDWFLYPGLRKIGIRMLPITRITVGFFIAAVAMAYAAITQHLIYSTGPCFEKITQKCPSNDINVWIQAPSYILIALSEIFAAITGLEYAYTKAPTSMKSLVMAMFLLTNAIGAILAISLSPVSVDPKLVWMYSSVGIVCLVTGFAFWFCFRGLNHKEDQMNAIGTETKGRSIELDRNVNKV